MDSKSLEIECLMNEAYCDKEPMRIFYSAKDEYFDVLFPIHEINHDTKSESELKVDMKTCQLFFTFSSSHLRISLLNI